MTAKFLMGMFGLIISGAVVAFSLATQNETFFKEGLFFASNIVMFFLGRSTARVPAAQVAAATAAVQPTLTQVQGAADLEAVRRLSAVEKVTEPVDDALGRLK